MNFSNEQFHVFQIAQQGFNVFITGPGGTGKTHWIHSFVKHMSLANKRIVVCAMTGCAAVLLSAVKSRTLHSWSGLKWSKGERTNIIERVVANRNSVSNWRNTDILIVDEVSMMSVKVFELLDCIAKRIRRNNHPFGGMQVIFVGDFFQLPPVGEHNDPTSWQFCFLSELWGATFETRQFEFQTMFRQREDEYAQVLNEIRLGNLSPRGESLLLSRVVSPEEIPEDNTTRILPTKQKVDSVNQLYYSRLTGEEVVFLPVVNRDCRVYLDSGTPIPSYLFKPPSLSMAEMEIKRLKGLVEERVVLKVGAWVMLTCNVSIEEGLTNGSQGKVIGVEDGQNVVVQFHHGVCRRISPQFWQSEEFPCLAVGQLPLVLAWAVTIHKIQGATLNCAQMDLGSSVFEYGQTYVALSRVKSLNNLYIQEFDSSKIKANPLVKQFYANSMTKYESSQEPPNQNNQTKYIYI